MNLLFIGDIVGRPGRKCVAEHLHDHRDERQIDIVIANAENASGGLGATPECLRDLMDMGVDAFTLGNHTWKKKTLIPALDTWDNIVRPANYPAGTPGKGAIVLTLADGRKLGLINLMGRVFMEPLGCPFEHAARLVESLQAHTNCILVDMHAEATSEKVAMGWHLEGRCSAVVGTHTHTQTADEWILPKGTAYISDVGMCGPLVSVLGVRTDRVIAKFLTAMPHHFEVANGPSIFSAVCIEIDDLSGRAKSIERILLRDPL